MIEYGLARKWVRRYVRASRGPEGTYLSAVEPWLPEFFSLCLEGLEGSGLDVAHIRLLHLDSPTGDVETIRVDPFEYIIFDETLVRLFDLLTHVYDGWIETNPPSGLDDGKPPAWVFAIKSNRLSTLGLPEHALVASLAYRDMVGGQVGIHDDVPYGSDTGWTRAQIGYVIGHEILHCTSQFGNVLATRYSAAFEESMLPIVRYFDQHAPVQLLQDAGSNVMSHEPDKIPEHLRATYKRLSGMRSRSTGISHEERLDWVLSSEESFGQEILCDYVSVKWVIQFLADDALPLERCAEAIYTASLFERLLRTVELGIHGFLGIEVAEATRLVEEAEVRDFYLKHSIQEAAHDFLTIHGVFRKDAAEARSRMAKIDEVIMRGHKFYGTYLLPASLSLSTKGIDNVVNASDGVIPESLGDMSINKFIRAMLWGLVREPEPHD